MGDPGSYCCTEEIATMAEISTETVETTETC